MSTAEAPDNPFPQLPIETEIYILPGGEVIVADLPAELAIRLLPTSGDPAPPRADSPPDQALTSHPNASSATREP